LGRLYQNHILLNYELSLEALKKAIELDPSSAYYHHVIAELYNNNLNNPIYNPKLAIEYYKKAIESDPTVYSSYLYIARIYLKKEKKYKQALDYSLSYILNEKIDSKNIDNLNEGYQIFGEAQFNIIMQ
jgi:tetratricopeptide (TPR) repeat protein